MAVYITGDTHGTFQRLSYAKWPEAKSLLYGDVVIVTGDFGLLWSNNPQDPQEVYWRKWLSEKRWTTAFVCGNHENHTLLQSLPKTSMFEGTVGVVEENIVHLRRGEVYTIQGKKFFTFGGANSIDKPGRTVGVSWWPEEIPSYAETEYGLNNLEKHQYSIDYIIAHTSPQDVAELLMIKYGLHADDLDPTRAYLQHVCSTTSFQEFYCGHWHEDTTIGKYHFLYNKILQII